MPGDVLERNVDAALNEIERDHQSDAVPLEKRGGEVLENVNDVFNLMAMNIKSQAAARTQTAE